ncbi:glycosyltransferase [uncultured Pontibacter sp.]|uniref:glycosyltransferase n=1 Tax=uncultured Pontibacter sp. TaxID=453356 RepID=UPI00261AFA09|nr:glycosyltransferase [uncultured Pontibacter sp.]
MISVVHLQTHLPSSGNAAYRLHNALCQAGVNSSMLSMSSDISKSDRIDYLGRKSQVTSFLNNKLQAYLLRDTLDQYGLFSFPILGNNVSDMEQVESADIIYLHWVMGGFLNLANIEQIAALNKPVIVFMHDMWAITGGCHYSFMCENYLYGCQDCQMFPAKKFFDLPVIEFKAKLKLYQKYSNLFFVTPSAWLYNLTKKSLLTKNKPVYHIPNIINVSKFKKIDRQTARAILSLDPDDKIIAFGAASPTSPYKGWEYLRQALELFAKSYTSSKVSVLIFGSEHDAKLAEAIPFKTHFVGRLRDDYSTALVYNAANVFVAPSMADNLPTTVMESLCCGTPVVGFAIGGIPDMVQHKENGYLAAYKDAEDLAAGIRFCLDSGVTGKLLPCFDTEKILEQHFALYEEMLSLKP